MGLNQPSYYKLTRIGSGTEKADDIVDLGQHRLSNGTGALDAIVQERFGRVEVDVFTAAPVGQSEIESIRKRLTETLGKEVVLHPYTDSTMIGGVKLQMGDQLIDGSVRAELRRMRDRLLGQSVAVGLGVGHEFFEFRPGQCDLVLFVDPDGPLVVFELDVGGHVAGNQPDLEGPRGSLIGQRSNVSHVEGCTYAGAG